MEFTGLAGYLLGVAVMFTAYISIIGGLFLIWVKLFDILVVKISEYFQIKIILFEFIFDKHKYKRKLKELEKLEEQLFTKTKGGKNE